MAEKIDFKRTLDAYRARHGAFDVVEVPEMQYLMLDGHGDPNTSSAFAAAIETLYPVAYALKFLSKRELGRDYVVPPLEGLWSAEDMAAFTSLRDKSSWDWTLMLMVPEWLDREAFGVAVDRVRARDGAPRLDELRLASLAEGSCVQTLHIGRFDDEAAVLARMHDEVIPELGLRLAGRHHEVYLSDFRRVAPERLRTILRQPVVAAPATSGAPAG